MARKTSGVKPATIGRSTVRTGGVQKREKQSEGKKAKPSQCYDVRFVFSPESSLVKLPPSPGTTTTASSFGQPLSTAQGCSSVAVSANYPGIPQSMVSRFSAAPLISSNPSQIVPMKATIVSAFEAKGPLKMTKYAFQLEVDTRGDENVCTEAGSPDSRSQDDYSANVEGHSTQDASLSPIGKFFGGTLSPTGSKRRERIVLRQLGQEEIPTPVQIGRDDVGPLSVDSVQQRGANLEGTAEAPPQTLGPLSESQPSGSRDSTLDPDTRPASPSPEFLHTSQGLVHSFAQQYFEGQYPAIENIHFGHRHFSQQDQFLSGPAIFQQPYISSHLGTRISGLAPNVPAAQPPAPCNLPAPGTRAYTSPQQPLPSQLPVFQPYQNGMPPWPLAYPHFPPRFQFDQSHIPNGIQYPQIPPQPSLYSLPHFNMYQHHSQQISPQGPSGIQTLFPYCPQGFVPGHQNASFFLPGQFHGPIPNSSTQGISTSQSLQAQIPPHGQPITSMPLNHAPVPLAVPYPYPPQPQAHPYPVPPLPAWVYHPDLWSTTFEGVKRRTRTRQRKGKIAAAEDDFSDEQRYQCPFCPRKFHRGNSLALHIKWHQDYARRLISEASLCRA